MKRRIAIDLAVSVSVICLGAAIAQEGTTRGGRIRFITDRLNEDGTGHYRSGSLGVLRRDSENYSPPAQDVDIHLSEGAREALFREARAHGSPRAMVVSRMHRR